MSTRSPAPRARHAFPRTTAAALLLLRGGLHTTRWARRTLDFSSAWTTAVVAGVLGLGLTFLLFGFGPPPEASVNANNVATQDTGTGSDVASPRPAAPPSDLEVELQRTYLPFGWDQDEPAPVVESMTPPPLPASQAFVLLPRDGWQAATVMPSVAASSAVEPYYLRAPRLDHDAAASALEAADVPPGEFGPAPDRNVAVSVERVSLTDTASAGQEAYALVVRNTGAEPVESVTIRDSVPQIEAVMDVDPPAAVTPDGALVWALDNLAPGEVVRLTVTLQSNNGQPAQSTASVDVASRIGVSTHVAQVDRPPPFAPTSEEPELVLPEPPASVGSVAATEPIPFDDELPDSVMPAAARPAVASEAFEDELPGGNPTTPPDVTPFDDVLPEPPPSTHVDSRLPQSEPSGAPFDPPAPAPGEADATGTTASDSAPPMDDAVLPSESAEPAVTAPAVEPDSTQEPAWAPRTLPMDEWDTPPRPVLNIKALSPSAVRRGEVVTAYYDITNTGNAPAEDVVLTVHLPEELLHKHGDVVEHRIERLAPGESRRARLLARARSTGTARLDATLSHGDQNDEQTAVSIRVVGQSAAPRR